MRSNLRSVAFSSVLTCVSLLSWLPAMGQPAVSASKATDSTSSGSVRETGSAHGIDFRVLLQRLSQKYEVPVVWEFPHFPVVLKTGKVDGVKANLEAVSSYVPILFEEMNLYPVDLFKQLKLQKIVLCTGIAFNGQRRGGIPDFENNSLYMDVGFGRYDELYVRKSFHHELYHLIDYRDDWRLTDTVWAALNPEGFAYGKGGAALQGDAYAGVDRTDLPGFLNRYAQSGVEEDKAEIFSYSIADSRFLAERSNTDTVIRTKIIQIKKLMASYCPAFTEAFWSEAGKTDRRALRAASLRVFYEAISALSTSSLFK